MNSPGFTYSILGLSLVDISQRFKKNSVLFQDDVRALSFEGCFVYPASPKDHGELGSTRY